MKKAAAILIVFGLVALSSSAVWAFGPCAFGAPNKPITQEQQAQMQEIWGKFMIETQTVRAQIAGKMEELKTLYAQTTPDKAKIAALQNEIVDLRAAMAKQVIALQAGLSDELYGLAGGMCLRMLHERGLGSWMRDQGPPPPGMGEPMGPGGPGPRPPHRNGR